MCCSDHCYKQTVPSSVYIVISCRKLLVLIGCGVLIVDLFCNDISFYCRLPCENWPGTTDENELIH